MINSLIDSLRPLGQLFTTNLIAGLVLLIIVIIAWHTARKVR